MAKDTFFPTAEIGRFQLRMGYMACVKFPASLELDCVLSLIAA